MSSTITESTLFYGSDLTILGERHADADLRATGLDTCTPTPLAHTPATMGARRSHRRLQ